MLTAPLFLAVLVWPRTGLPVRARLLALVAALAGVLVWAIPLVAANGGLEGYLTALGSQAGEDFSGVVMLWTTRQAKVAALAILNSFVWPWEQYRFGVAMLVLAAVGAARLGWRDWRALVLCAIAFAPYAIFHLLFHETATMRYALPLIVPVALLAATAIDALGRRALTFAAATAVVVSLATTVPAARAYGQDGSPAFRVFAELPLAILRQPPPAAPAPASGATSAIPALGMHASLRRVEEWQHDRHSMRASVPVMAASGSRWSSTGGRSPTCPCSLPPTRGAPIWRCSIRMRGRSWHLSAGPFRSGHSLPASGQEMPTHIQCGRQAGCSTKGGH